MKLNPAGSDVRVRQARSVPIESELARRGIKLRGHNERVGPCPKCGGTDRFSINVAKQLFNCRGCGVGGDVIDLVQHLDGVDFIAAAATLAGEPPQAKANGNGRNDGAAEPKKIVAAKYRYEDEGGNLAFGVVRIEYQNADGSFVETKDGKRRKSFRQGRPDPQQPGKWLWNVDGAPIVPYRLPELIEAISSGHFVVVVEGEAKADLLRTWNISATCCAGGAGKWSAEHAKHLRGAGVVILPDNDAPGRKHCDAVGAALQGIAATVRVLELPNLPPKGDIVDWAAAGGTVEQLHDLIEHQARPWAPSADSGANQDEHEAPGDDGRGTTLSSVRASSVEPTAIEWYWPDRFAVGKVGIIAGLPDEGKGQILCFVAAQGTRGGLWPCDEGCAPQGNVILLTAEDDLNDTVIPRLLAANADRDCVEIAKMVRINNKNRMFSLVTDLELLRRKIIEVGNVNLVLIDPITAYLGVGKIDSFRGSDVRAVLTPLADLAAELRVAVIAIMHFNKKTDVTNALLRISDSLAFGAVARHVYGVVDDAEHDRKLFVRAKNNVASAAGKKKALAYHFGAREVGTDRKTNKPIWAPHVVWEPRYVDVTATEAMQAAAETRSPAARDDAKKFLLDILAKGPVPKAEIEEAAEANGIAERTLFRAKAELNIAAVKHSFHGPWVWQLPEQPQAHWTDK